MFGQRGNKACFLYTLGQQEFIFAHTQAQSIFVFNGINCNIQWITVIEYEQAYMNVDLQ